MNAVDRQRPQGRMKPEPRHGALLPLDDATLQRLDALIEHLLELRDLLDGDPDVEPERHDGEAMFPCSPLYGITDPLAVDGGPGDREDAEAETDEDSDADEWSAIDLNGGLGPVRWA